MELENVLFGFAAFAALAAVVLFCVSAPVAGFVALVVATFAALLSDGGANG